MSNVPTNQLPGVIRALIKQLRYAGKAVRPREVHVVLQAGNIVTLSEGWTAAVAAGIEQLGTAKVEHWMGSDGEPNTTVTTTWRGPVVRLNPHRYGSGKHRVDLVLATGLHDSSSEGPSGEYIESPHRRTCKAVETLLADADWAALGVLVDRALESEPFPCPRPPSPEAEDTSAAAWAHYTESN